MTPVKVCSICNGAIVGFGNIAERFAAGYGFASGFPAADAERRSVGGMIGIELLADESRGRDREARHDGQIVTAVTDSSLDEE
jgi:hypothetical protein